MSMYDSFEEILQQRGRIAIRESDADSCNENTSTWQGSDVLVHLSGITNVSSSTSPTDLQYHDGHYFTVILQVPDQH